MEELDDIYTTGDSYLDAYIEANMLRELEEQETAPQSPFNDIFEVDEVDDDTAAYEFSARILSQLLQDNSDFEEFEERFGPEGVIYAGRKYTSNVHEDIVRKESNGNYKAFNPSGGGSGAVGKYQFRWDIWKNDIQKVTGIDNPKDFLNSPDAQEYFYHDWYVPNKVMPWVAQIKRHLKAPLSDDALIKLYHFRGPGGAIEYLQGVLSDKPESYNSSISSYTGIQPGVKYLKTGGWVRKMQAAGINMPTYKWNLNNNIGYSPNLGMNKISYDNIGVNPVNNSTFSDKDKETAERLAEGAEKLANIASQVDQVRSSVNSLKGAAMSTTLSGVSSLANTQLQKLREEEELSKLYKTLQDDYSSMISETLGKPKNIWE